MGHISEWFGVFTAGPPLVNRKAILAKLTLVYPLADPMTSHSEEKTIPTCLGMELSQAGTLHRSESASRRRAVHAGQAGWEGH